ncbi:MAG TPA: flagellar biosynthesis anti-sigma factor FlgM [Nitrospirales bacterium]|jgi:negative regulator of flagellin synthesis FlgM
MNISNTSSLHDLAGLLSGLQDVTKTAKAPKVEPKQDTKDEVRISTRAKQFQKAYELVAQTPDVRPEKVTPLQDAIKTGTYNVRGEQVANKLIANTILDTIL